jgi:hypothetical protein
MPRLNFAGNRYFNARSNRQSKRESLYTSSDTSYSYNTTLPDGTQISVSIVYNDNGTYTITIKITYADGTIDEISFNGSGYWSGPKYEYPYSGTSSSSKEEIIDRLNNIVNYIDNMHYDNNIVYIVKAIIRYCYIYYI